MTDKTVQEVVDQVVAATETDPPLPDDAPPTEPTAAAVAQDTPTLNLTQKKKRLCRHPGCTKVIKSQGHCQRHGARAKRCKVEGCEKQAQGTHDGMCKRHWKALHFPAPPSKPEEQPPPAQGTSVYDMILPSSISYRPPALKDAPVTPTSGADPPPIPEGTVVMPLVQFLRDGADQDAGWHRNSERRARGMFPVASLSSQLEPWERQLALVEILLLSGGTSYANFRDLAHAWGREKGFHNLLATSVCERRGEVDRKRRSDAGTPNPSKNPIKKIKVEPPPPAAAGILDVEDELKMASVDDAVVMEHHVVNEHPEEMGVPPPPEEDKKEAAVDLEAVQEV